jgi:phosphoglycerate dehydrogenase-like enzyme
MPIFQKPDEDKYLSISQEQEDLAFLISELDSSIEVMTGKELPRPADYEYLVAGRPNREYFEASDALHTLIIPFAGLPDTTRETLLEFDSLQVHNLHFNAPETAELAMALLLAAAKSMIPIDQQFRKNDWSLRYAKPSPSILLEGKTALILGYGSIGKRIANSCNALGMNVIALRSNSSPNDGSIMIEPMEKLEKFLPNADVLVIALPLTPATEGLLGRSQLDFLPEHSIIINIGRAKIIEEEALYNVLANSNRRAGLDVWYKYPANEEEMDNTAPSNFPFHELQNVVMSPHRGGHSQEMQKRRMQALAKFLNQAARGEPLPNAIDVNRGY